MHGMGQDVEGSGHDVHVFEASFAQERLWVLHQLEPESPVYNLFSQVRWTVPLDVAVLGRALNEVVHRHEALRTTFAVREERPVQLVAPTLELGIELLDLSERPPAEREHAATRLAAEEAARPFDLADGPLLRMTVVRLGTTDHVVLLTMHRIVSDGWSMGVLSRELGELYDAFAAGRPSPLPELPVQYADFAVWQRQRLQGPTLEALLTYWRGHLAGAPAVLTLPSDRPRPPVQSHRGALHAFSLPAQLGRRLRALAQRESATPFMALLAAFKVLLARLAGQTDIVVGTPIANRPRLEFEGLIGFFVNTLALRTRLDDVPSFRALLARVREVTLAGHAHQDLPFERLVEDLQPQRNLSHHPIFQVMFALNDFEVNRPDQVMADGDEYREASTGTAKFDLTLFMIEVRGRLRGIFEYNTDLFDTSTIERMARQFTVLLEAAVADPDFPVDRLPLMAPNEGESVLANSTAPVLHLPDSPIFDFVDQQALASPHAIALEFGDRSLTYRDLVARADRLARCLVALGIGPECRVGIYLDRSLDHVIAILAVLKAGGCYVPLDPAYPAARLAFICADAAVALVIVRGANKLPPFPVSRAVALDALVNEEEAVTLPTLSADHLAYILYTSGSTGIPKGVAMPHRALTSLVTWQWRACYPGPKRVLHLTSLNFDVSAQEIFATLGAGGVLVIATEEERRDPGALLRRLSEARIERIYLPFVALQMLAVAVREDRGQTPLFLQEVISAGEQLQITEPVAELVRCTGIRVLRNQYGPTETHVASDWPLAGDPSVWPILPPIGRPIGGVRLYVLDRYLESMPVGVPGELYIGGNGLARGYVGRPDWTAEKFLSDPHASTPGARMYRTGDLGRLRADGAFEFLGRADRQVKIRGFRVEIGEVESVLASHQGVRDAVVVASPAPGGLRLVAYIVPAATAANGPDADSVRRHCKANLPDYMVPVVFVTLPALPLTPSGKVDHAALPDPWEVLDTQERPPVGPRTPVEEKLTEIFSEALKRDRIGIHDDFFDLGGHSLLATRVASRIRAIFGLNMPLRSLFEAPTIAELADLILELRVKETGAMSLS